MDAAIRVDDIVIADVVPAKALMVATDTLDGAGGIGTGGGAVDDDFGDCSHFFVGLMGLMGLMGGGKNAAGMHGGFFFDGCNGVAAYLTIDGIEAIDTIGF